MQLIMPPRTTFQPHQVSQELLQTLQYLLVDLVTSFLHEEIFEECLMQGLGEELSVEIGFHQEVHLLEWHSQWVCKGFQMNSLTKDLRIRNGLLKIRIIIETII